MRKEKEMGLGWAEVRSKQSAKAKPAAEPSQPTTPAMYGAYTRPLSIYSCQPRQGSTPRFPPPRCKSSLLFMKPRRPTSASNGLLRDNG